MIEQGVLGVRNVVDYRRETRMILDELSTLIERKTLKDSKGIPLDTCKMLRSFVERYRNATASGNPVNICLGIVRATKEPGTVVVFAHIPGACAVSWLPALVLPFSNRIETLMREVGRLPRFPEATPERVCVGYYESPKPRRGGFPPPTKIELIEPNRR